MIGKTSGSKIFWTNRGIVGLQSLKVSCLSDMHSRFYEFSKLKKWMCELCTFLQIRSHIFFCCCIKSLPINICGSMKAAKSVSTIFCTIPKVPIYNILLTIINCALIFAVYFQLLDSMNATISIPSQFGKCVSIDHRNRLLSLHDLYRAGHNNT